MKTITLILIILSSTFITSAQDASAIFKRGLDTFNAKKYDEAMKDFTEVIRLRPDFPNAYGMRALCNYRLQLLQKSPRLIAVDGIPPINKAEKNVKAVEDLTKAIQLSPTVSPTAPLYVFEFYFNRYLANAVDYDYRPAIADLKAITKANPNYPITLTNGTTKTVKEHLPTVQNVFAEYLIFRTKGYFDSIAFAEKLLANRFDEIENAKMEQDKAAVKKMYLEAIENYQPSDAALYYKRGSANAYVENWQAAIADYNEALRLKPNDEITALQLARAYKNNKQFDLAIAEYDKIIASSQSDFNKAGAIFDRATALPSVGKANEALKYFNEQIAKYPQDQLLFLERGRVYLKKGNKQLAKADFNKAIELAKTQEYGFYTIKDAQKELDILDGKVKPDPAKNTQAVQPKPTPQSVKPTLTQTPVAQATPKPQTTPTVTNPPLATAEEYLARGKKGLNFSQIDSAISDFTEAVKLRKNYVEAISALGDAYRQKGNYSNALNYYNDALRLNANYVPAYIGRALIQSWSGKNDSAIADLEKALKLEPNNQNAKNILEQIKK